jgi:hypothetical protein
VDAVSGAVHWLGFDHKLVVYFLQFLHSLAAAYPQGPLVLAMEHVRMHDAKVVRALRFMRWMAARGCTHGPISPMLVPEGSSK